MADLDFDTDLRALFDSVPPAADADAFAMRVDRGLGRMQRLRLLLVSALGLFGMLIAWSMFGLSLNDVAGALNQITAAVSEGAITVDNAAGWAAAVLLLTFGTLAVRPLFSES